MIDWIKYLPVRLRHDHKSTDCRGPNFARANPIQLVANGCKISMRAPRHSSKLPDHPLYVKDVDGLQKHFKSYTSHLYGSSDWSRVNMLSRRWSFWNAWFAGSHSEMYMLCQLLKRSKGKAFGDTSFFHPRSFEFALTDYLDDRFGHREPSGVSPYRAPMKWKTHKQLPIFSASFFVEKADGPDFIYCFPVSDDCIFLLNFSLQTTSGNALEQMEALAQSIIDTVTLELSPRAADQVERVKADRADMSLTEHFAPLKWPIVHEDLDAETRSSEESQQRQIED